MEPADKHIVDSNTARQHFDTVLDRAERGNTVVIKRDGKPIAVLSPWRPPDWKAFVGSMKGEITYPEDFNDPDPEIERLFGMRDD